MFQPTGTLEDIVPGARWAFEELLAYAEEIGFQPRIVSAGRTCAQQNALSSSVTGAHGCQSWHVLGRAVDLAIAEPTCDNYARLGRYWERLGGFWGGRWTAQFGGCGDAGHFHLPDARTTNAGSPAYCPSAPGACESFRQDYLAAQFAEKGNWIWAVLTGGAIAAGVVWWKRVTR